MKVISLYYYIINVEILKISLENSEKFRIFKNYLGYNLTF